MKIGIIGCGLSGILLSYLLKDEEITVYEKNSYIGGLCRSKTSNGFTYDVGGSHIIFSRDKEILSKMLNLLGDNYVTNKRNTKIYYNGILVKYPFENGLGVLPSKVKFECLMGYINAYMNRQKSSAKIPINFDEWIKWKFGDGLAKHYLVPYNDKLWETPLQNIDFFWVKDRVPDPKIDDLVKAALNIETEGYIHQLNFYYPKKGGIQAIIEALKKESGAEILLDQKITLIKREEGKWIVYSNNKKRTYDILISTIPIPELLDVLDNVPKSIMKISKKLKSIALINIFLGVEHINPKYIDLSWLYVPNRKDGLLHRVSFTSNYSPINTPENYKSINIEITTNYNSKIWNMEQENLINQTIKDIIKMGIINKEVQIVYQDITKWKYAYVIYDMNYQVAINKIKSYFKEINLIPYGRFGLYEYLNMDQVFIKAINLVKELKGEKHCLKK